MSENERLERLSRREWLEVNGLGSYASGTSCGAWTRRYHGLFVAALEPPVRRHVLLSRLEETLYVDGEPVPLTTSFYRGAVAPEGWRNVAAFEARPIATWTFASDGVEIEKRVWMPHGSQAVAVTYRARWGRKPGRVALELRPLVAFRDFHSLASENDALDAAAHAEPGVVEIRPYPRLPRLYLHHNADRFRHEPFWYRAFEYPLELERGFDGHEDLFTHGVLEFDLTEDEEALSFVYASLDKQASLDAAAVQTLEAREMSRRDDRAARAAVARHRLRYGASHGTSHGTAPAPDRWSETFATRLAEAAEQFLATRADGRRTVIAGFHWFADWGRDTFIALPGLAMATGRWPLAFEILRTFAAHVEGGLIPNRFPEDGAPPDYATVDAALWFVESVRRYVADSGDLDLAGRELMPRVEEIVEAYRRGTRFGIGVDPADHLLAAGAEGVALTWMDAVVDGEPVTPRRGKPVEVNALWYNALRSAADIAELLGRSADASAWRDEAALVRDAFNARFVAKEHGWLYDVVDGPAGDDAALRPNQLFAISLHHDVLARSWRRPVVEAVAAKLLTPLGLRTLDPDHPSYVGRCDGPPEARDRAYHNGTVWPWLLGPFGTAYLRAYDRTPEAREFLLGTISPLSRHLGTEGCLGQISEIADGDAPHRPRGCIAQAWSVAEVARVLLEELR